MQATLSSSDYESLIYMAVCPPKINWALLIHDIAEMGISSNKQAEMLGKERSTLQRWLKGAEPQFKHGHAILVLHQKICGQQLTIQRFQECEPGE